MSSAAPILGIGELLWDLLPDGPRLGGAPFNASVHLARLGHPAALLTAVGDDERGRLARQQAVALGLDAVGIQVTAGAPTGAVDVVLDPAGTPRYAIRTPAAYEAIDPTAAVRAALAWAPSAVVLGTLAQRSPRMRSATRAILRALPDALVVYDANLREGHWTAGLIGELVDEADVLRCSEDELQTIGGTPDALLDRHRLRAVVLTRGARGAAGWSEAGRIEVPAPRVEVIDTIGAGDAMTAGVTHAFLAGASMREALEEGTRLAAEVLAVPGALGPVSGVARPGVSPDER